MPTLRQFEYLVAVADYAHFGRAAASLNVSQPTLSQQLRQLEERLEATLVERTPGAVALTPIGRQVVERLRPILTSVEDVKRVAARSAERMAGTFRFGVTPTLGPYLMPGVIAQLHRTYPDMKLYIRDGIPDEQLNELRRGRIDLMLAPLPVIGDDLEIEPLFREPLQLVVPPDHAFAQRPTVSKADLAGRSFLSLDPRHHFHRQIEQVCTELGASVARDYEGTSLDSIRQMVGSGLGLALLPELYLRSEAGGETMIRRIEVTDWKVTRSIAAVWRANSPSAELFRTIAQSIAKEARGLL